MVETKLVTTQRSGLIAGVVLLVAGSLTPSAASAYTARVAWTTWLRAGPGREYSVLDEVDGGRQIEVLGCDGGWCRVLSGKVVTYLEENLIARVDPQPAAPSAQAGTCFDARRDGYGKGETYSYCLK